MLLSSCRFPEAGYSNEIEVLVETDDRAKCPASWMELDLSPFPSNKSRKLSHDASTWHARFVIRLKGPQLSFHNPVNGLRRQPLNYVHRPGLAKPRSLDCRLWKHGTSFINIIERERLSWSRQAGTRDQFWVRFWHLKPETDMIFRDGVGASHVVSNQKTAHPLLSVTDSAIAPFSRIYTAWIKMN